MVQLSNLNRVMQVRDHFKNGTRIAKSNQKGKVININ